MRTDPASMTCPAPIADIDRVLLGHGSGGQLTAELLRDVLAPALDSDFHEDAAVLWHPGPTSVLTTDSFVVTPRFFPGGDIGSLAVHGTINDLAMRGARPIALCLAYIIEEGLPIDELRAITVSVAHAAREAGTSVVTGDTKVVPRGQADGLYITTTGLGTLMPEAHISASYATPGDVVIMSGPIGLHGTAVLAAREDLGFDGEISSDSRSLHRLVETMLDAGGRAVHTLRDPTRGGLASALNELAATAGVAVELREDQLRVPAPVAAACDLLGLDPLHVACEGALVAFVAPGRCDAVLRAMRAVLEGRQAHPIGVVLPGPAGRVTVRTALGATRVAATLVGEQLPRIC